MRKGSIPLALAISLISAVWIATPAPASTPQAGACLVGPTVSKSNYAKVLNADLVKMSRSGLTTGQISQRLARQGITTASRPTSGIVPFTTANDISLPNPSILYDSCSRIWSAYATWNFTSISALAGDRNGPASPQNIGGNDGFGMAFSRNVTSVTSYSLDTWGLGSYYPVSYSRAVPVDAGTDGVAYDGQDAFCSGSPRGPCTVSDYSFYHGSLIYSIGSIGCGTIQAFSKYGHDWSGTSLSGISVGLPLNIQISFSSSSYSWVRASQPSSPVTPC